MGSPMKRPLEVYPAAWPGSKLIGIENVALSPGVFRSYHRPTVGVSLKACSMLRNYVSVAKSTQEPEASAG
jgi:hypothetical protein